MRNLLDKLLQGSIKLCLLTGVAFTFAACYGPPPGERWYNDPEYQDDQNKVEQQLQQVSSPENAEESL